MKKTQIWATYSFIFFTAVSFWLVTPANSGSDENWYAKNAWYFSHNVDSVFEKSGMTTYPFPDNLILNGNSMDHPNLVPCWWEDLTIQSKCQNLNVSKGSTLDYFDRVTRAPFYQLVVGKIMQYPLWQNNYETGRTFSFLLSLLIIFLAIRNISYSKYALATPYLIVTLTPSWYFLSVGINPISHEISFGILLATILIRLNTLEANIGMNISIFLVLVLFGYSRPLAPIWACCIILFYHFFFEKLRLVRSYMISLAFIFVTQFKIDSGTWRYGDGSPAPYIKPSLEFYTEELIRTLLNMGNWVWQTFGNYRLGSSVEIPLIVLLIYVLSFWTYTRELFQKSQKRNLVLMFVLSSYFLLPLILHLSRSNQWPGWWSGRYQMPLFLALILILLIKNCGNNKVGLLVMTVCVVLFSSVLNFARWNWGLFPTYTPIISNGWSFAPTTSALYFLSLLSSIISSFILVRSCNSGSFIVHTSRA